ncbi:hypothetical protein [Rhizobium rhizogenes]|uniref:hypothetical protein n=1 Tax=Rhizobium rhizogenes TaxID=359 RepID=UPI0022C4688F|nr:hypothetical protein [Rhizobium rhizogenes]MCZ7466413.1 hypothetical protein [Rhizobium rhizogenes]
MIDPGFSLEEIHEMLDAIERSLSRLKAANLHNKLMPMTYIPEAYSVHVDLDLSGVLPSIGLNQSVANKLKNIDAKLRAPVMIAALSRTRSYLRMLESEFGGDGTRPDHADQDRVIQETLDANPPPPIQIWTEQWVYVKQGSRAKQLISDVAELLDEAILLAKTTNLPEDQAALTDIERAQLVAILETTLAVLKAPMLEPGLLKKTARVAKEIAEKTARKRVEEGLGVGLSYAAKKLWELIASLL